MRNVNNTQNMTEEGNHNQAYQLDSGCSSLASSEFESKYGSLNRCGKIISKGLEDSTCSDEKETYDDDSNDVEYEV